VDRLRDERDSLALFRKRVSEAGLIETGQLDDIDREVALIIDGAVVASQAAAPPTLADLTTDVYLSY
jgi:pyruvate dehydrogenase E1 component alpha subunit